MELTGKVIAVLPMQSGVSARTGNPWAKQQYVIEMPGQYPRRMTFDVFGQDRIQQFNIQMNEEITVSFDIDAQEYQGKWYNKIQAWQVARGGAQGVAVVQQQTGQPAPQQQYPQQGNLFNQPAAPQYQQPSAAPQGQYQQPMQQQNQQPAQHQYAPQQGQYQQPAPQQQPAAGNDNLPF